MKIKMKYILICVDIILALVILKAFIYPLGLTTESIALFSVIGSLLSLMCWFHISFDSDINKAIKEE